MDWACSRGASWKPHRTLLAGSLGSASLALRPSPRNAPVKRTIWYLALILAVIGSCADGAPAAALVPEFTPVAWLPAIRALPSATTELRIGTPEMPSRSGDTETVLVQVSDARRVRQWSVEFSLVDPSPGQQPARSREMRFFTNSGHELVFAAAPLAAERIRVRGPYSERDGA